MSKGAYLQVLDDERKWWKCRNEEGEVGFVPSTMVKAIIYTDVREYSQQICKRRGKIRSICFAEVRLGIRRRIRREAKVQEGQARLEN